eukprot:SAG11_NODE_6813_length_1242_cov_2.296588_1_plen_64_part_00
MPKTTCLPFRCGVPPKQRKNCELLEFGPLFAIDRLCRPSPVLCERLSHRFLGRPSSQIYIFPQ